MNYWGVLVLQIVRKIITNPSNNNVVCRAVTGYSRSAKQVGFPQRLCDSTLTLAISPATPVGQPQHLQLGPPVLPLGPRQQPLPSRVDPGGQVGALALHTCPHLCPPDWDGPALALQAGAELERRGAAGPPAATSRPWLGQETWGEPALLHSSSILLPFDGWQNWILDRGAPSIRVFVSKSTQNKI